MFDTFQTYSSDASHDLSSTAASGVESDWLDINGASAGWLCDVTDVYILACLTPGNAQTDPDPRTDCAAQQITLTCAKGIKWFFVIP